MSEQKHSSWKMIGDLLYHLRQGWFWAVMLMAGVWIVPVVLTYKTRPYGYEWGGYWYLPVDLVVTFFGYWLCTVCFGLVGRSAIAARRPGWLDPDKNKVLYKGAVMMGYWSLALTLSSVLPWGLDLEGMLSGAHPEPAQAPGHILFGVHVGVSIFFSLVVIRYLVTIIFAFNMHSKEASSMSTNGIWRALSKAPGTWKFGYGWGAAYVGLVSGAISMTAGGGLMNFGTDLFLSYIWALIMALNLCESRRWSAKKVDPKQA